MPCIARGFGQHAHLFAGASVRSEPPQQARTPEEQENPSDQVPHPGQNRVVPKPMMP